MLRCTRQFEFWLCPASAATPSLPSDLWQHLLVWLCIGLAVHVLLRRFVLRQRHIDRSEGKLGSGQQETSSLSVLLRLNSGSRIRWNSESKPIVATVSQRERQKKIRQHGYGYGVQTTRDKGEHTDE
jgi:hypothetical protein